jgi:hypothetical protein
MGIQDATDRTPGSRREESLRARQLHGIVD